MLRYVLLAGLAASCSSPAGPVIDAMSESLAEVGQDGAAEAAPDGPGNIGVDATPDRDDETLVDAGFCLMPLAVTASACPGNYDAIDDFYCALCFGNRCTAHAGTCGDYLVFQRSSALETSLCYYYPTTRALVALTHCANVNAYCGGQDYCYSAGTSVGSCARRFVDRSLPMPTCPDGGAPD